MRRPLCMFCLIFVVVLAVFMSLIDMPLPDYGKWEGEYIELEGQVYQKEQRILQERNISVVYLKSIKILNDSVKIPQYQIENVICYMQGGEEPPMGSYVKMEGKLKCFPQASNPGEFDMRSYYRILKLDFKVENATLLAVSKEKDELSEKLYQLRKYFGTVLEQCFNKENASIMKAMLLGDKSNLDKETKKIYQESGIIHILAISGLHISIIGMGIYKLLRKCFVPLKMAAVIAAGFIWCYGLMTGMSTSSIRAIFMFVLRLAADMVGRTYDMLTALCLAAVLLLAEQPRYAMHSGFLFSFGAVVAIGLLLPALFTKRPIRGDASFWKKAKSRFEQAFALGVSVALVTLPVHMAFYFQFPIYSILLNLIVIPLMTSVMYAGLFCMLTGDIVLELAKCVALIDSGILWFYEKCCLLFSSFPFGNCITGKPEYWQIIVYIILLTALVILQSRATGFWKVQWIILALLILTFRNQDGLVVTAVDVGQGDGIYIRSDSGKHYLIDGGSSSKSDVGTYQIIPFLKSQGVGSLSAIFVTHGDSDHCNGTITLLKEAGHGGIKVENLILPDIADVSRDENYMTLVNIAEESGIPVAYMSRGQRIMDGEMMLTCLHPLEEYQTEKANEYSLILELEYGNFSALFTGDIEGSGEAIMQEYIADYRTHYRKKKELILLKVAHHGSANSTGEEFLNQVSPKLALISCGAKNSYGHPHKELLKRLKYAGCEVYITRDAGAVTFWTDGKKIKIDTYKESH